MGFVPNFVLTKGKLLLVMVSPLPVSHGAPPGYNLLTTIKCRVLLVIVSPLWVGRRGLYQILLYPKEGFCVLLVKAPPPRLG